MFGMGPLECIIIIAVICILFTPRVLKVGKAAGKVKTEFKDSLSGKEKPRPIATSGRRTRMLESAKDETVLEETATTSKTVQPTQVERGKIPKLRITAIGALCAIAIALVVAYVA